MTQPQLVACRDCGAEIRLPVNAAREEWHCSDCGASLTDDERVAPEEVTHTVVRGETYGVAATTFVPPAGLGETEQLRQRPRYATKVDDPPKRVFFSNVLGFPLQGSVIGQWMLLSCSFTGLAVLNLLMVSLYEKAAMVMSGVIGFIALPIFWIALWTLSYAASCFLIVVQETGAGNNEIRDWMDGGWKEWAAELFCLGYIAAIPMIVAWPIVKMSGYTYVEAAPVLLCVEFLFFPIALLSALEQDSIWLPFSVPILKSLTKAFDGWCVFFLVSASLLAAVGGVGYFAMQSANIGLAFVVGPAIAAAILIYGRLIGRLGWLILDRVPRVDPSETEREVASANR